MLYHLANELAERKAKLRGTKVVRNQRTHRRLLVYLVSDDAGAVEHILARAGCEAFFLFSGTRVLVGALISGELAFWATCVWRNIAEIGRGEGCHEGTLQRISENNRLSI